MSSNVQVAKATSNQAVLPERVQEALGELVGAANEGLLALSVGVGLGVLSTMMEAEVDEVVGQRSKHRSGIVTRPARSRSADELEHTHPAPPARCAKGCRKR